MPLRFARLLCAAAFLSLAPLRPVLAQVPADVDPRIAKLVASVSEERLGAIIQKLVSFGTRNTLSSADSPTRGVGAARQWIFDEFKGYSPRLQVSFDTYQVARQGERITRDIELRNVVAILSGRSPRRVYVSGHYDSLARVVPASGAGSTPAARPEAGGAQPASASGGFDWTSNDNTAPGANDDGSGTALTLELARVFAQSGLEFDATLVFVTFAGEEQGLVGAMLHAQRAAADKLLIEAVFNNDMVGNANGGNGITDAESVRVFSEGPEDSASRQIARYIRRQAGRYYPSHRVVLIARHDRFGRGGDHTALNQHGFPGVRITESNENYARQHTVEDTFDGVSLAYLARNALVNASAVATLAMAPQAPGVLTERRQPMLERTPTGYDAHLKWTASPGAAGYLIVWREAWASDWQHELRVGSVTDYVMPNVSIDDYVFGVAAIGSGGHESLVSAYVNPPRPEAEIKTVK